MNIEHFALNVPDPLAMANWYTQNLGMRIVRAVDASPHTRFLADESGRVVVEIYHQTKASVPAYASLDPLVFHTAFVTADVRQTRDRLLAAGASPATEIVLTPDGDEMVFLRDPWGIAIQLVKRACPLVGADS
jgi:catechol 2,3-dioxygenase-like lactoylglutathione lyase family enzyme